MSDKTSSYMVALAFSLALAAPLTAQAGSKEPALPDVFTSPVRAPDFFIPAKPSLIEHRILRSKCARIGADMSRIGMDSGLNSGPESGAGAFLDKGRLTDGTRWFLVRNADDPEITYCGIALTDAINGTNVSVTNVRPEDMETVRIAAESGDFLCTCKQLAK